MNWPRSDSWLGQLFLRIHNIWARGLHFWPMRDEAQLSEQMGWEMSMPRERLMEIIEEGSTAPFRCSKCRSEVEPTDREISEIFTDVIQLIRRGKCPQCDAPVEFENRYFRGKLGAKIEGEWYVMVVRPSLLERGWYYLTHWNL